MFLYRFDKGYADGELVHSLYFQHETKFSDSEFKKITNECILEEFKLALPSVDFDMYLMHQGELGIIECDYDDQDLYMSWADIDFPDITHAMESRGFVVFNLEVTASHYVDGDTYIKHEIKEAKEIIKQHCIDTGKPLISDYETEWKIYAIISDMYDIEGAIKAIKEAGY